MNSKISPLQEGSLDDFSSNNQPAVDNLPLNPASQGVQPESNNKTEQVTFAKIVTKSIRAADQLLLRLFENSENFQKRIEKEFNELILEEQTESHKRHDNLFYWVRYGDLNTLKEKIITVLEGNFEEDDVINKRDAVGGHIIHQAYLLENYKIGRWLVQKYPHIALMAHDGVLPAEAVDNKPELK
eukprot:gene7145-9642_t